MVSQRKDNYYANNLQDLKELSPQSSMQKKEQLQISNNAMHRNNQDVQQLPYQDIKQSPTSNLSPSHSYLQYSNREKNIRKEGSSSIHNNTITNFGNNNSINQGKYSLNKNSEQVSHRRYESSASIQSHQSNAQIYHGLDRKQMPLSYSINYPNYLRAEQPFKIYNHYKTRGSSFYQQVKKVRKEAYERLSSDLKELKQEKDKDLNQFISQVRLARHQYEAQNAMKRATQLENALFLRIQMKDREKSEEEEMKYYKSNQYKSHFGPEQTEELNEFLWTRKKNEQQDICQSLNQQLREKKYIQGQQMNYQKQLDLGLLESNKKNYDQEQQALRNKNKINREKLQKAWQRQIQIQKQQQYGEKKEQEWYRLQ